MTRKEIIENRIEKFEKLNGLQKDTIIRWRYNMLKAMQTIVCGFNNEEAYMSWINGWIPDAPMEEDFEDCAADYEHFEEQVQRFKRLMKNYGNDGFCRCVGMYCDCIADEKVSDYWKRKNNEE